MICLVQKVNGGPIILLVKAIVIYNKYFLDNM
jgi:hypothetical protein